MTSTDETAADPMWEQAYMDVQKVLDKALGTVEADGAGAGIAADVWLLADQRDKARAEAAQLRERCAERDRLISLLIAEHPVELGRFAQLAGAAAGSSPSVIVGRDDLRTVLAAKPCCSADALDRLRAALGTEAGSEH